jgi:hypothetical protein
LINKATVSSEDAVKEGQWYSVNTGTTNEWTEYGQVLCADTQTELEQIIQLGRK